MMDKSKYLQSFVAYLPDLEFYCKIALACTGLRALLSLILGQESYSLWIEFLGYWLCSSLSFYIIGLGIEWGIKNNKRWKEKFSARVKTVRPQTFPAFTLLGIVKGEVKSAIAACVILWLAPEVYRSQGFVLDFSWFLMRIVVADLCFYIAHRLLHEQKALRHLHRKHHEFSDSSSFVASHKSLVEYIITTTTDLLPIFIFGYDITQLCAWTVVGNAYNLEGHSSLSLCFIQSDFHDLHHSQYHKNYGIYSFWDRVFKTLNPPTLKPGPLFLSSFWISLSEVDIKHKDAL